MIQADLSESALPEASFDLVVSRLVLHYLATVDDLFGRVFRALLPGGRFVFSVEHPVITSSDTGWQGEGERQAWLVDDYFATGERVISWMGSQVVIYHRTVEDYFLALQGAGFAVERVRESRPRREYFTEEALYRRRLRIPLFLLMSARKGA